MNIITEIKEQDINPSTTEIDTSDFEGRELAKDDYEYSRQFFERLSESLEQI